MRLVLTSPPLRGESLEGYLSRLGALNAYPGPHWILQAAKLRDGFDRRPSDLEPLSAITEVPVKRLKAMSHWPLSDRPDQLCFEQHRVQMSALSLYHDRVCPLCVGEYGYSRQLWHLKAYAVCHLHQVALVDQCRACGWSLRWQRPSIGRCRCGVVLEPLPTRPPAAAVAVARRLSEIAAVPPGQRLNDLGVAAKIIWFFGTDHGMPAWRSRFMAKPTAEEAIATVERAAPFVFDWEAALAGWLRQFLPAPKGQVNSWILETPTLSRLKTAFHQPETEYVLDIVKAHLSAVWDTGLRRRSEFCISPRQGEFVRTAKAARLLRSNPANVKRLIAQGVLEGTLQKRGKRDSCLVSLASIHAHLAKDKWLKPKEAAEYLGISSKRLAKKCAHWNLESQLRGVARHYLAESIDAFLERLAPQRKEPSPGYSPWNELAFPHQAVELVVSGKIEAFRYPALGSGFRSLLFEKAAIRQAALEVEAESETRKPAVPRRLITVQAALRRLAINHPTLKELVRRKHLTGRIEMGRLSYVELGSLEVFEAQYSGATAFARRRELPIGDLLYRLRCSEVAPVVAPDGNLKILAIWSLDTLCALDLVGRLPPPSQLVRGREDKHRNFTAGDGSNPQPRL